MIETVWLSLTDPEQMLDQLQGKASDRKLRLFACACCRRVWHLLADPRSRDAVEISERYADSRASVEEFELAAIPARKVSEAAAKVTWTSLDSDVAVLWANRTAYAAAAAVAKATAVATTGKRNDQIETAVSAAWEGERGRQRGLLRDLFAPIFHPVSLDPSWLRWNDGCVGKIAQAIYDDRRFSDLPILADALEDAGCTNAHILTHCRQPGEHVRGCWVLDLLLGKT